MTDKQREYFREYLQRMREKYKPIYDEFMKLYPFTLKDLDGEIWKVIPNFEDYHCSNFGRVKSFKGGKIKILKPVFNNNGYFMVNLYKNNKLEHFLIARLVAELFLDNPFNKPQVNHIDGCKFNNFVGNLEWATSFENQRHAVKTGLRIMPKGEESCRAKLTNEQVQYIRNNPDNLTGVELAEKFAVNPATISDLQCGKKYKNAGGEVRIEKLQHPRRLPDDQREKIRELNRTGKYLQRELAEMFGVSRRTIQNIINGK